MKQAILPIFPEPDISSMQGDCLEVLRTLPTESINMCVTSPPYWGLRSYLPDKVVLRDDLTKEELQFIEEELAKLGLL